MKKAKLFFSALFLLLGVTLSAQNVNISGTVKDASTGEGIPFAAIQVKGTSTGSATDANGAFSFYAPSNATERPRGFRPRQPPGTGRRS